MNASTDPLYHLPAARSAEQLRYMEELEASGVCIFCPEHVERYHREPIVPRRALVRHAQRLPVRRHRSPTTLIVPHRHVSSFDELPDEAGAELWAIRRMLKSQLDPVAVATVERSGDMRFNGGSVAHLHTHFVALPAAPESTVRFRVSASADAD